MTAPQPMPDAPRRIRLSRAKGWRMPESAVKVDRSTPWGNPFVVGKDGTADECLKLYNTLLARGLVCISGRATMAEQIATREHVFAHVEMLRGRDLACWCRTGHPCHADTLLKLANAIRKEPAGV